MPPTDSEEQKPPAAGEPFSRTWFVLWLLVFATAIVAARFVPFKPLHDVLNSFSWLTEKALKISKHLFESYGYLTVFLAPLLENTIFLGAIIPGTIIMLLAGVSAHDGLINLFPAIPLAIVGAWIGDTISYGAGRFGWRRLGAESRLVVWAERMREPLLRHSFWIVLIYHFAGYSRLIGPAAAGFIRMRFGRWVLFDYAGSALWVSAYMIGGYLLGVFGLSLDATNRNVRVIEVLLFATGAITIGAIVLRAQRRQQQPAA